MKLNSIGKTWHASKRQVKTLKLSLISLCKMHFHQDRIHQLFERKMVQDEFWQQLC